MENAESLIWQYIQANWVVSFTAHLEEKLWSANAFYVTDFERKSLLILSSKETQHGRMLLQNPIVSGTISNQEKNVSALKGLQFSGEMTILENERGDNAFQLYCEEFPIAKQMRETVWQLRFSELKYTDNSLGFGTKLYWKA
ncbi:MULTISPECIES: hypothetical protein [Chitinophagaceae]